MKANKKYAVVYVDRGPEYDGLPRLLGVYDTLADAAQDMLADIRDSEAENSGYAEIKYTTVAGELWLDAEKTRGCTWAVRSFEDELPPKVFVVFRVHRGSETVDFETVCGVFSDLGDAKACLGNEFRAARPEDKWVASEERPEDNDFMSAEIVQTDDEFDGFEITEKEVQ